MIQGCVLNEEAAHRSEGTQHLHVVQNLSGSNPSYINVFHNANPLDFKKYCEEPGF